MHNFVWLGQQTVSSLEKWPLFIVCFIERFHCTYMHTLSIHISQNFYILYYLISTLYFILIHLMHTCTLIYFINLHCTYAYILILYYTYYTYIIYTLYFIPISQVAYWLGGATGACLSAYLSSSWGESTNSGTAWMSLVGGALLLFGARLASGCTR